MTLPLRLLFLLLCTGTFLSAATAYTDNDLDGVDDAVDLCPDTPFDILVDEHGCDMNRKKVSGKLLLQAGIIRNMDDNYENTTLFNLFADYSYGNWDIAVSTANYNTNNLSAITDAEDDLFITAGYTFKQERLTTKVMAGTKFAFMQESGTERNNDWYAALNLGYQLNEKTNLFGYYSYTLSSDSTNINYYNFHTLSIGAGYTLTPHWYSSLAYNYASTYFEGGEAYRSISWFNTYMLPNDLYISMNYAYGLSDDTYDHTFSFNIGVFFE